MRSLSRRTFGAVAVVLAASLVGCSSGGEVTPGGGGSGKDNGGTVHLSMFIFAGSHQGDVPKDVVKRYEADHPNVKVDFVESNTAIVYPKMVAAKKTTPNDNYVDFGIFNASSVAQGVVDGMWQSIDPSAVPNMKHVLPSYVLPNNMALGYQNNLIGLLYNKNKVKNPPDSWSALWDSQYQGKVTWFDYDWTTLVLAARLNGGSESNIDPGFKLWAEHASQLKALVNSNDQLQNLLVSGQAELAPWYAAIAHTWQQQGAPLGFTVPKEGAVAFPIYLTMVSNLSPAQKKAAQDIMNLLLAPAAAGKYGDLVYSTPLTDDAQLTAQQQADPVLHLDTARNAIQLDWGAIAKQDATWRQRWDSQVKSKMR